MRESARVKIRAVILMLATLIVGAILFRNGGRLVHLRSHEELRHLEQLRSTLNLYATKNGRYPSESEWAKSDRRNCGPESDAEIGCRHRDAWGELVIYKSNGTEFSLVSLGRDHKLGGTGEAKDLSISDNIKQNQL